MKDVEERKREERKGEVTIRPKEVKRKSESLLIPGLMAPITHVKGERNEGEFARENEGRKKGGKKDKEKEKKKRKKKRKERKKNRIKKE